MRILLSTVAAAALMASPALAQQLDTGQPETPGAPDAMAPGTDFGQIEQDLSAAGFTGASELTGAEVYRSTLEGQDALIIVLDEQVGGVAGLDDPMGEPGATAAIPEDDFEEDFAADPAFPEDDDLAETPDPAFPEGDDLAETPDPAFPEDDALAGAPEDPALDEPAVTGAIGEDIEHSLSAAGFDEPRRSMDGQVYRTTAADGRTVLIVLGADVGAADPMGPGDTEFAPQDDELGIDQEQDDLGMDQEQLD